MLKFKLATILYFTLVIFLFILPGSFLFSIFIPATIIYLVLIIIGTVNISFNFYLKAYCKSSLTSNKLAITFDDGPDKNNTPKILDLLHKYKAKATFFVVGKSVAENPDIVRRIYDEGHLIGNHSNIHHKSFPFKTADSIRNDVLIAQKEIDKIVKQEKIYFRPPFGITNPSLARGIENLGFIVVGWSIRSFDTKNHTPEKTLQRITQRIKGGDIILLHDTSEHILQILEELLKFIESNEYKAVRVDELESRS